MEFEDIMNDNWAIVPLGEVTERIERPESPKPGVMYRQVGVRLWGKGAYERESIDGAETRYKTFSRVEANDIVVNKIWARNGSVAVIPPRLAGCFVSTEFPQFLPVPERLEPRWFHWLTKTSDFWQQCDEKSHGTSGKNRIRPEKFLEIQIPLPPLDEQRHIVARIEELAAKVEQAQELRRQSAAEVEALVGTVTAELFEQGKEDGWKTCQIGDFATEVRYGTSDKAHDEEIGTPILRMGNIQNGQLDFSDLKYLELSERDFEKLKLRPGDILVNRTNSAELVGKCAVFNVEQDFVYASYIIRLRVDENKVDPNFVARYINSPAGRAYMFTERKQMTGQANINSKKLLALPLAIPSLSEQRRIVAYLENLQIKLETVKRHQTITAARLDALLPSILDRAFKGAL